MPNNARQVTAQAKQVEGVTRAATRRALNAVVRQARTLTLRELSKAMGLTQTRLRPYISTRLANYQNLESAVRIKPHTYNIASFAGRQTKKGVSAAPWGKRRVFPHTFLLRGVTAMVRVGKARYPIRPVYGPRITREFGRAAVVRSLQALVHAKLEPTIQHELEYELSRIGMRR
jgi:hypothetical protein